MKKWIFWQCCFLLSGWLWPQPALLGQPTKQTPQQLGQRLWQLCRAGRMDDVTQQPITDLINQGADLNYQHPDDGTTALMWCVRRGHVIESYKLLTHGANPYAKATRMVTGANGDPIYMGTVLTAAIQGNDYGLVRYLVEVAHVPVNEAGPGEEGLEGPTPMLVACLMGKLDVVLLLLKNGASLHKPSVANGLVSPLMVAAGSGQSDVCLYLLKMGANPFQKDKKGRTAKDWAVQNGQPQLAKLIQTYIDQTAIPNPLTDWNLANTRMYTDQFRFDNLEQTAKAYEEAGRPDEAQLYSIKAAQALFNEAQAEQTLANPPISLADLYQFHNSAVDNRLIQALSGYIQAEQHLERRIWYFLGLMASMPPIKDKEPGLLTQRPLTMFQPSAENVARRIRQLQTQNPADPLLPQLAYLLQYTQADGQSEETSFYNRVFGLDGVDKALASASTRNTETSTARYITLLIDDVQYRLATQDTVGAKRSIQTALALSTNRLATNNSLRAVVDNVAGNFYRSLANPASYRQAEQFYQQEQSLWKAQFPTDTLARLRNLLGFARLYANWYRANSARAQQQLKQALELATQSSYVPAELWLSLYGQWAELEGRKGNWRSAITHYTLLLDRLRSLQKTNHPVFVIVLYNLGCAYREDGEWQLAVSYFRQASQYARQFGQLNVGTLYEFGKAYESTYQIPINQALWEAYAALTGKTATQLDYTNNQPWLAFQTRFNWLATTQHKADSLSLRRNTAAIEELFLVPLQQLERSENLSPFTVQVMLAKARTLLHTGDGPKAETLSDRAVMLASNQWGQNSSAYWRATLMQVRSWIAQRKDPNRSEAQLRNLCKRMRDKHLQVQPYLPAGLSRLYQQETESTLSDLLQVVWQLNKPTSSLVADVLAFSVQIRTYQMSTLERLGAHWRKKNNYLDQWMNRLQSYKTAYEQQVQNRDPTPDERESLKSTQKDLMLTEEAVLRLLLSIHQENPITSFAVSSLQQQLAPSEAFIQFIRANNDTTTRADYFAILVRASGQPPRLVKLTDEQSLQATIPAPVTDFAGQQVFSDGYRTLFEQIWKPLRGHLAGITKVQYSTAGLLNSISLAGLLDEKGKPLANTVTLLARFTADNLFTTPSSRIRPTLVLYGDVHFGSPRTAGERIVATQFASLSNAYRAYKPGPWSSLPATVQEVKAIDSLARTKGWPTIVRAGSAASEPQFLNDATADRPTILHVASHGFYLGYNPDHTQFFSKATDPMLRSGIVLAGANDVWLGLKATPPGRDGILTALEVATQPMSQVQLAVLSACETGLGEMQSAETQLGMARALKLSGVNYVLVSLWPVMDDVTKDLMIEFYQALFQGSSPETALQLAQKKLSMYRTVSEWGAFKLIN